LRSVTTHALRKRTFDSFGTPGGGEHKKNGKTHGEKEKEPTIGEKPGTKKERIRRTPLCVWKGAF